MSRSETHQPSAGTLASCAHDLRGALTVINGYVGLLRRPDLSAPDHERALAGIASAVGRANSLIDDLLAGESAAPFEGSADLGRLAEQAAADLRATTGRDVIVRADVDRAVHGDEIALARVLENLLSNAAKYAPEGSIELNVATADVGSIIEVADRGPGIPPADRKRVMQPFARLERDEARLPGTGLGLTVVRSIADALGGHVEILENPGGGTIARVVLPDSGQS